MKIRNFENAGREAWMQARIGKITGSRVADIINKSGITKEMIVAELESKKAEFRKSLKKEELQALLTPEAVDRLEGTLDKKTGFYQLIAERLMVSETDFEGYVPNETPMDRGTRLQKQAIARFSKETGKKVSDDLVLWTRDDNESIAISPDATVLDEPAAVESKCLSIAHHVEAYITKQVPDEYKYQVLQYFVVNDKLETLYFPFFDPRMPTIDFFFLTVHRKDIGEEARKLLAYEIRELKQVEDWVLKLSNF
jgi:hypothetical protein